MNDEQDRPCVVYDCVVFLQGLIKETGPGVDCLELFEDGKIELFISEAVLNEIGDVLTRPDLQQRFPLLTKERAETLLENLRDRATYLESIPVEFTYQRDPKDEIYVNLALAAGATYVVSRDNDLLDLMKDTEVGKSFRDRFPGLRILNPIAFLRELEQLSSHTGGSSDG
ncbi:MAG TPA: putative toxin-antitoxin system toxin component, PIN family [Blastocatellia bacterium]